MFAFPKFSIDLSNLVRQNALNRAISQNLNENICKCGDAN